MAHRIRAAADELCLVTGPLRFTACTKYSDLWAAQQLEDKLLLTNGPVKLWQAGTAPRQDASRPPPASGEPPRPAPGWPRLPKGAPQPWMSGGAFAEGKTIIWSCATAGEGMCEVLTGEAPHRLTGSTGVGGAARRTASGLAWMVIERSRSSESGRCFSLTGHRSRASSVSNPSITLPKTASAARRAGADPG